MKNSKRLIASLLTGAMVMAMVPVTAFAAAADVTKVEMRVGGSTTPKDLVVVAADMVTFDKIATEGSKQFALTPEELEAPILTATEEGGGGIQVITATGTAPQAWILSAAADKNIIDLIAEEDVTADTNAEVEALVSGATGAINGETTGIAAATATARTPGEVIWIIDGGTGTEAELVFYRVILNQVADGNITGDSTLKAAIVNVVLPTNLDFAMNPLQLENVTGDASQVASPDFVVVNKSTAPVQVDFIVDAVANHATDKTTFVDARSDLKESDTSLKTGTGNKEAYIGILGAQSVTGAPTTAATAVSGLSAATWSYAPATVAATDVDRTDEGTFFAFDSANEDTGIGLVLGGLDETTPANLAANNGGIGAFKLYGMVNTYAPWETGELTVTGAYTLTALRKDDYTSFLAGGANATEISGLNVKAPAADPSPIDASIAATTTVDGAGFWTSVVGADTVAHTADDTYTFTAALGTAAAPFATVYDRSDNTVLRLPFYKGSTEAGVIDKVMLGSTTTPEGFPSFSAIGAGIATVSVNSSTDELVITDFGKSAVDALDTLTTGMTYKLVFTIDGTDYTAFIKVQA